MNLSDLFTMTTMTAAVNKLPVSPGLLGDMGLFEEQGITTTSVAIDVKHGRLALVPNTSRNADGHPVRGHKPGRKVLETLHLPLTDQLAPSELQNIAPFGSETVVNQQAQVINDRMAALKANIEATREWLRVGALRGILLDADGSELCNLYTFFGVKQQKAVIDFANRDTNVRNVCLDAKRHAESKLGGVIVNHYQALCGPAFFDALTSHPSVEKAYQNYQEAQDRIGGDLRKGFRFGGLEFIEYNAEVSGQAYIPTDSAQMFPIARGVFKLYNAPANYNEALNTVGLPYYAKTEERKMGKGWDIEVQANPLALCLYPEALVELRIK